MNRISRIPLYAVKSAVAVAARRAEAEKSVALALDLARGNWPLTDAIFAMRLAVVRAESSMALFMPAALSHS